MNQIFKIIFRRIPIEIILSLKNNKRRNKSVIARDINSTYVRTNKILRDLKEIGLVSFKREGRQNIIILTKKGNRVADLLYELKKIK